MWNVGPNYNVKICVVRAMELDVLKWRDINVEHVVDLGIIYIKLKWINFFTEQPFYNWNEMFEPMLTQTIFILFWFDVW